MFVNEYEVPQVAGGPTVEQLIQALLAYCESAAICYKMLQTGAYDLVYGATIDRFSTEYADALEGPFGIWGALAAAATEFGFSVTAGGRVVS